MTGIELFRKGDGNPNPRIKYPRIKNKIRDVSDELCVHCTQAWEGECRAYLVPHSKEEYEYRKSKGGVALCITKQIEEYRP